MVRGSFQILPHPTDSPQQYFYYQIKLVATDRCGRQDWDTISVVLPSTYGPAGLNGMSICGRLVSCIYFFCGRSMLMICALLLLSINCTSTDPPTE